jgi:hypothetical protein
MNNISIDDRYYDIMQFRLRSSRSKKRMQHEDRERTLLRLHRERSDLYKQQRNLGWMELDPPVMRGWKRYFVLRDDVAKSKHAQFFQKMLDKINTIQINDKKSFTAKKRKYGKKIQVERIQKLVEPDIHRFKRMNFSDREAQFFSEMILRDNGRIRRKFVFVEPWRFVLRIRPNLITKTRVRDEAIEKRIHEINTFLKQRELEGKLDHLLYGSHKNYRLPDHRKQGKYKFKSKSVQQLLDEVGQHTSA